MAQRHNRQDADLAILNKDPFAVPVSELSTVTSVATIVGGRFAADAEADVATSG